MRRWRVVLATLTALVVVVPVGVLWARSLVPSTYGVMEMGVVQTGRSEPGGAAAALSHAGHVGHGSDEGGVSVADLTGPPGPADVTATLVARREAFTLADGQRVEGFTLNHSSPGPTLRARAGELLEVTLVNESVGDGTTLHWHGVDVPNAEDGVAGVTQDAVPVGGRRTYRFVVDDPGTYWYHSHQVSHEQVVGGLWGMLIIDPTTGAGVGLDLVAGVHSYDGRPTVNGDSGEWRVDARPGEVVRVRVANTDPGLLQLAVAGTSFRVLAVDARDVVGPEPVTGRGVLVPGGGRVDLGLTVPADGSAVAIGLGADGQNTLVVGPADADAPEVANDDPSLDLLDYGTPAPLGFDPERPDREFEYSIGRRPGFLDGRPGLWWTINGQIYPDVPMFVVAEGDVVRMTIANHSGQTHPMHLHGHHVVVLSRNGRPATGSPLWLDSVDVSDGDTYEVAFVADNPGIWIDHCHNLPHAEQGLVAHLVYEGVSSPYLIGGEAHNHPE